jgi:mono/diheme cytochrome c family protein
MALALLANGCATRTNIPIPDLKMANESGHDLASLQRGHQIYLTQCSRCHEAKMPSQISREDWHIVTPGMAWNAGISEADEAAVLNYIMASL